jgi:hypothetical protein
MHYSDDDAERKKMYHDLINFAAQGMTENAQFLLAIKLVDNKAEMKKPIPKTNGYL